MPRTQNYGQAPEAGDVILSRKPASWDEFFAALQGVEIPAEFLDKSELGRTPHDRDPFQGWRE
jgi:antitoxin VapB